MGRFRDRRPSPALLVAIVALVFAVAGSSVAAINSLTKKQKKQTANIARNEIAKAAPGLSVANAAHAQQADTVQNGSIGPAQLAGSIPAAHVTRTTAQQIPDDTNTPIQFTSERYDSAAIHDNTTNNTRLTAPVTGVYGITAQVDWQAGLAAEHELSLRRNGTTVIAITSQFIEGGQQNVSTQVKLQAGDFVESWAYEQSSAARDIQVWSEYSPEFSMTWLAPGP
jgi:hypothetical protein